MSRLDNALRDLVALLSPRAEPCGQLLLIELTSAPYPLPGALALALAYHQFDPGLLCRPPRPARLPAWMTPIILEVLVRGASRSRLCSGVSAPMLTPHEVACALDALSDLEADGRAEVLRLLAPRNQAARALLLKALARRVEASPADRLNELALLTDFLDAFAGASDPDELAHEATFEGLRPQVDADGFAETIRPLHHGGRAQAIALLLAAHLDPLTALRYRAFYGDYLLDTQTLMERYAARRGGVLNRFWAREALPTMGPLSDVEEDARRYMLVERALRCAQLTRDEHEALCYWEGRRNGRGEHGESIEEDRLMQYVYRRLERVRALDLDVPMTWEETYATGKQSEHQRRLDELVPCSSLEEFLRLVRHAHPRDSSHLYEGGTRTEDCSAMFHAIVAEPSRFWYDHRRLPGDMYRCTSRLERSVTFVAPAILFVADKDSAHVIAVTHCVRDPAGRRHFRITDPNGEGRVLSQQRLRHCFPLGSYTHASVEGLWIAEAFMLDYRLREIPVPALHPSEED